MRVVVDETVCERHGLCSFLAPAAFTLTEDLELEYVRKPDERLRDEIEEAERACPTQAISLEDDPSEG